MTLLEKKSTLMQLNFTIKYEMIKYFRKHLSQPIGVFVETFERLSKEHDAVISIHLSSGISGTLDGAVQAGDMVDGIEVNTFDSEVSSMVQGFYAIRAAEMANAGAGPTAIMQELHMMKTNDACLFYGGQPRASSPRRPLEWT